MPRQNAVAELEVKQLLPKLSELLDRPQQWNYTGPACVLTADDACVELSAVDELRLLYNRNCDKPPKNSREALSALYSRIIFSAGPTSQPVPCPCYNTRGYSFK